MMKLRSGKIILSIFNTKNICEIHRCLQNYKKNNILFSNNSIVSELNKCVKCELISYYDYHIKECGHACCINSINKCCTCTDKRSSSQQFYPKYIDGIGFKNIDNRNIHYCPVCKYN